MKKFLAAICAAALLVSGCLEEKNPVPEKIPVAEVVDVDLTKLNANMLYSAVFDIVENPAEYRGKTIKIRGTYFALHDPAKNEYHRMQLLAVCRAWNLNLPTKIIRPTRAKLL